MTHVNILVKNECVATRKVAMKSNQIYGDIRVIKYYDTNTMSQHLYKLNMKIGEVIDKYIRKEFPWIISIILKLLEKPIHNIHFIHTLVKTTISMHLTNMLT